MTAKPDREDRQKETTRICVKNVPPNFTESKLRSHLTSNSAQPLAITDCKILRTKDGVSRKLAFVGLKNAEMAKYAISYFDKSFAGTSRLSVEAAFSKGGNSDHRPWSKHSKGSSKYDTLHKVEESAEKPIVSKKAKDVKEKVDSELERKKKEFIDVMMGGKKSSSNLFWANDDGEGEKNDSKETNENKNEIEMNENEIHSDSDSSSSDSDDDSVDVMKTYKSEVSDLDFLKSKVLSEKENLSDDENEGENSSKDGSDSSSAPSSGDSGSDSDSSDDDDEDNASDDDDSDDAKNENIGSSDNKHNSLNSEKKTMSHSSNSNETEPLLTARLFVRNLPFSSTEEDLRDVFSSYGTIIECHIPVDDTNRNKGYAFVKFSSDNEASNAMENLDATPFQGRLIHIMPAREEKGTGGHAEDENDADATHKMKKEMERQKDAGNTTGWNASFVRGDAVVDNLASRLGLDKGAILDVKDGLSSGNAAVRLALGETQVIEENRKYFEKHGVDIGGLVSLKGGKGGSSKRSSDTILVKNLPFDTSLDDLSKVFISIGGKSPQVLLPPSRTIALVIYENNNDAKRAFRKLAYKRFKHVPLYLEWASLSKPIAKKDSEKDKTSNSTDQKDDNDDDEAMDGNDTTSIYVKNLNFRTTEDTLRQVFEEVGEVRSVRIPTKVAARKSSRSGGRLDEKPVRLSMGFGFVEFSSDALARNALSKLQGKAVDGHKLELKISKNKNSSSAKVLGGKKKPSTKIIVRNVPFQASRTEILQLFGSFGQLKTVRLPKKFDGGHRGFAFVEFTGAKEALNAMKALASTHLYGRHLVLEWADDKSDIDTLRDKAKRDSAGAGFPSNTQNKKIRFD